MSKETMDDIIDNLWCLGEAAKHYAKWSKTVSLTPQEKLEEIDNGMKEIQELVDHIYEYMTELKMMEDEK